MFNILLYYQYCEYNGGYLAEIPDEHDEKAIEMFLLTADPSGQGSFWIGLTDLFREGEFIWSSTGEIATYLNWAYGRPDNMDKLEHFVEISAAQFGRKWNDCRNDCPGRYALCQFSLR
jgi:hypothetical protein